MFIEWNCSDLDNVLLLQRGVITSQKTAVHEDTMVTHFFGLALSALFVIGHHQAPPSESTRNTLHLFSYIRTPGHSERQQLHEHQSDSLFSPIN